MTLQKFNQVIIKMGIHIGDKKFLIKTELKVFLLIYLKNFRIN